ncbi:hypothetical protein BDV39DRAFT_82991 [Aspergillus sergii]|uniref:Uncharacterized protein n=1 Tax=Aspergillus sergii TaxID=1034303 RepID=A0A5N6X2M7_9EURO|nr:hypothetical protein BDV39DRAFT_82991 [Aspergillus sergii]
MLRFNYPPFGRPVYAVADIMVSCGFLGYATWLGSCVGPILMIIRHLLCRSCWFSRARLRFLIPVVSSKDE